MDEDKAEQQSNRGATLDVFPLSKGKRMLLFLGDFFLVFILALFLSNIVVYPIAKSATDYDTKESLNVANEQSRYTILYENKLLYYQTAETKNNINDNLEYTFDLFISYYVDNGSLDYEIFHHYYSEFPNADGQSYLDLIRQYDTLEMFDLSVLDDFGCPIMKQEYKDLFAANFDEKDEMDEEGKAAYGSAFNHFFLTMFYTMMNDIAANDLSLPIDRPTQSYNDLTALIKEYEEFYDLVAIICSSISFALASIVFYFVYPLVNKKGRTPTQSVIKVDRVDRTTFAILPRRIRLLNGLYATVLTLPCLLFVPVPTVSVNYVFSISTLLGISIVGFAFVMVAFFTVIFDKFNRGLTEIFTHSVAMKEEMLDEIYKAKGYYV